MDLVALGLLGMLIGLGTGTSAPGATVVNLSLMQQQTVTLTLSGFLFLAGCILSSPAAIVRAIAASVWSDRAASSRSAPGSGARIDESAPAPTVYTQTAQIADPGISLAGIPVAKRRGPDWRNQTRSKP